MRLSASEEHIHYFFSAAVPPVLQIRSGQSLVVETRDASNGQIRPGITGPVDRARLLPITGPVAVEGARPGDALAIAVEAIELAPVGHAWIRPGLGILNVDTGLPYYVREFRVAEKMEVAPGLAIPLRPMVGIIGVATPEKTDARAPGDHGGNLDCLDLAAGHTLLLPVLTPGANLSLGDVHAAMGDGEVCGSGVEIAAEIGIRVDLLPGAGLEGPVILAPGRTLFLASAPSLDQAVRTGLLRAMQTQMRHGVSERDAYMFASLAGQARVCQVVNGLTTAAFELPWEAPSW